MSQDITHNLFSLQTADRHSLFAQEWKPSHAKKDETPKPIIGIVHGLGEHSGRYYSVARFFVQHGYHVVGYDHRGHGKTGGTMPPFHILQNDIQCLRNYAIFTCQAPIILYGQSLGGTLVLTHLANQPLDDVTCAIVSSPLITPTHAPPRWKMLLGEWLLPWLPKLQLAHGLKASELSHNLIAVNQFRQDPLVRKTISIALGYSMLESGKELLTNPPRYHVPLLLMHGSTDQITSAASTLLFATQVGIEDQVRVWDGLLHELHFEENAADVLEYVRTFIEKCLS